MFYKKNVLVTGGAGFIGTNVIKRLIDTGAHIRTTLHKNEPVLKDNRIEYIKCDLEKAEDCNHICQDMDYVILCAAVTSGAAVMENTPLVHLTPNIIMNILMLEAAYNAGVKKVLFISSNTVYPVTDLPAKENDVTYDFFEKYYIVGWMKRFSEIVCEMYSTKIKRPMDTIIIRPANIYGPYDDFDWETSHVIPALIRKVVERHDPIEMWGDGSDIKDFIYIDDLVEGLLLALQKIEGFNVVNIASGMQYCLRDLLNILIELDGYENATVKYDTTKPTMIPKRLIDTSKAKELLGYKST
ncbi:MAG: NAD(P)-dependent oxidoreductase, partial [Thermodesulfobacteriota bacterium]|nr:NAD(P)-dependent oxidoreductase [Thermodesulfobacteriota bacterium]